MVEQPVKIKFPFGAYLSAVPAEVYSSLEKGFSDKDVRMVFLKVEPFWDNLRSEPRFLDVLKRMRIELL